MYMKGWINVKKIVLSLLNIFSNIQEAVQNAMQDSPELHPPVVSRPTAVHFPVQETEAHDPIPAAGKC